MNEPVEEIQISRMPPSKYAKHHDILERIVRDYSGRGAIPDRIDWKGANRDHPEWFQQMGVDIKDKRTIGSMGWYVRTKIQNKIQPKSRALKAKVKRAYTKRKVAEPTEGPTQGYLDHDNLLENLSKEFAKITPASTTPAGQLQQPTNTTDMKVFLEVSISVRVVPTL